MDDIVQSVWFSTMNVFITLIVELTWMRLPVRPLKEVFTGVFNTGTTCRCDRHICGLCILAFRAFISVPVICLFCTHSLFSNILFSNINKFRDGDPLALALWYNWLLYCWVFQWPMEIFEARKNRLCLFLNNRLPRANMPKDLQGTEMQGSLEI
jgi:hypothetical protein